MLRKCGALLGRQLINSALETLPVLKVPDQVVSTVQVSAHILVRSCLKHVDVQIVSNR